MVDMSKEAVEGRLKEAVDLIGSIDTDKLPQEPDTICLSCGRSVLVGKCCDNPNRVIMEKKLVSAETWDHIQELIANPPKPSKALRELITGKRRYEIRTK